MHYTRLEKNDIIFVCPHEWWVDKQIFCLENFHHLIVTDPMGYNESNHNRAEVFSLKTQTRMEFWCVEVKESKLFVRKGPTGPRAVLDEDVKKALLGKAVKMIGFVDGHKEDDSSKVCRVIGYGRQAILDSMNLL